MTTRVIPRVSRRIPYFARGQHFEEPVSIEEAFARAQLRWEVEKREVQYPVNDRRLEWPYETYEKWLKVPDQHAVVRSDNQHCLGVVGNRYEIVQNTEVEELLEGAGWRAIAAGSFDGGAKAFCVLHGGPYSEFQVDGDPFWSYMIARWNHDGSGTVKVFPQIWRQVCTNGMMGVAVTTKDKITIRHTASAGSNMILARELIPHLGAVIEAFASKMMVLKKKSLDEDEISKILANVFPAPQQTGTVAGYQRAVTKHQDALAKVRANLFAEGELTAYSLIQALNEYEQWGTSHRGNQQARSQILRVEADRFPKTEEALALVTA